NPYPHQHKMSFNSTRRKQHVLSFNPKAVQKQLGHKSAMLTLDTYADLFDGDLDEVAGRMDEGLRGLSWGVA
ncbi:hypothetical protein QPX07_11115, partial [Corynebacterium accolens]|nr:hypothetical protein [Corynebacterium accolens]